MRLSIPAKIGLAVLGLAVVMVSLGPSAGPSPKKIRLIYTNDISGYIEPCGCPGNRAGGLARQVALVTKLAQENPNSVIVDSGNVTDVPNKMGVIMAALAAAKYDAVGVGEADLRLVGERFFTEAADHKVTIIDTRPNAPKTTVPYVIKNVDGVKVGITSFGGTPFNEQDNEYERRKSAYLAYKTAREASDILILLDQGNVITPEWLERNGKRMGPPDVVISGTARTGLTEPMTIGKTRILPTSVHGRYVGVVDIEFVPGEEPKYSWSRVDNVVTLPIDEAVQKMVDEFLGRSSVTPSSQQPSAVNVPISAPPKEAQPVASVSKPYYPPDLCKACHIKQFNDWVKSKHAKAIKTLMQENRMVPDCLKCHSEQFRRLGNVSISPSGIGGVDCTTCHIKSLPHGMERKASPHREKVDPASCLECHTKERSSAYNEQTYFPKISHLGADSESDSSSDETESE